MDLQKEKIRIRDTEKAALIISYPSNTVIHTFLFIRDKYLLHPIHVSSGTEA